jgi:hypothetical protein
MIHFNNILRIFLILSDHLREYLPTGAFSSVFGLK